MRIFRWLSGAVAIGCLAGACGGNAGDTAPTGGGSAGSASVGDGNAGTSNVPEMVAPAARVPLKHRAAAVACDHERPPGSTANDYGTAAPEDTPTCTTDADCVVPPQCTNCRTVCVDTGTRKVCLTGGLDSCLRDEDCSTGENGRCENLRGAVCTYDECFADGECDQGGPCACESGFWSDSNACLVGNCRTDADCGSGGFCSPTFGDCGGYSGVIGYYCHTPEDRCVDDEDCVVPGKGAGYCMYRPDVAHWACGYGQCLG